MDDRTLICHKVSCERCKNIPFRNRIYLSSFQRNPQISLCTNCFSATPDELELTGYSFFELSFGTAHGTWVMQHYLETLGIHYVYPDQDQMIEAEHRIWC